MAGKTSPSKDPAAEAESDAQELASHAADAAGDVSKAIDAWYARLYNRAIREGGPVLSANDLAELKSVAVKAVSPPKE